VITSRDPAILEVTGGSATVAALHVEATNAEGLSRAMVHATLAQELLAPLRERALARAALFTWRKTAERTREVYDAARARTR